LSVSENQNLRGSIRRGKRRGFLKSRGKKSTRRTATQGVFEDHDRKKRLTDFRKALKWEGNHEWIDRTRKRKGWARQGGNRPKRKGKSPVHGLCERPFNRIGKKNGMGGCRKGERISRQAGGGGTAAGEKKKSKGAGRRGARGKGNSSKLVGLKT